MPSSATARKPIVVTATEVQNRIGYLVSRAAYDNVRTIIERRGEPVAVLVPFAELAILEAHDRTAA